MKLINKMLPLLLASVWLMGGQMSSDAVPAVLLTYNPEKYPPKIPKILNPISSPIQSIKGKITSKYGQDYLTFSVSLSEYSRLHSMRFYVQGPGINGKIWNKRSFVKLIEDKKNKFTIGPIPKGINRIVTAIGYDDDEFAPYLILKGFYNSSQTGRSKKVEVAWRYEPVAISMERLLSVQPKMVEHINSKKLQQPITDIEKEVLSRGGIFNPSKINKEKLMEQIVQSRGFTLTTPQIAYPLPEKKDVRVAVQSRSYSERSNPSNREPEYSRDDSYLASNSSRTIRQQRKQDEYESTRYRTDVSARGRKMEERRHTLARKEKANRRKESSVEERRLKQELINAQAHLRDLEENDRYLRSTDFRALKKDQQNKIAKQRHQNARLKKEAREKSRRQGKAQQLIETQERHLTEEIRKRETNRYRALVKNIEEELAILRYNQEVSRKKEAEKKRRAGKLKQLEDAFDRQ